MKNKLLVIFGVGLIAVGPLSFVSGVAYTLMLPNLYKSTAVAKINFSTGISEKYTTDALVALTKQKAVLAETPQIFYPVIKELKLQENWGNDGDKLPRSVAYKILQNSVHITANKQAVGLILFSVQRDDPYEASKIANAICESYANQDDEASVAKVALPNMRPVSPNLFMNVSILIIQATILSGIGLALLIIGIKKSPTRIFSLLR